jgi:4'-phosphopantetheinyl transferase
LYSGLIIEAVIPGRTDSPLFRSAGTRELAMKSIRKWAGLATLKQGHVDVWWIDLARADASGAMLSVEEQNRAHRLQIEIARNRFTAARGAVKTILASYLNCHPTHVNFDIGPEGKPKLAGDGLQFNLAHSGDWAVLAITRDDEIGVDCEAMNGDAALITQTVNVIMSEAERALIAACPPERRLATVYRIWTRKEAIAKATGRGLTLPLTDFTVLFGDDSEGTVEVPLFGCFSLRDIDAPLNYAASLCSPRRHVHVRYR